METNVSPSTSPFFGIHVVAANFTPSSRSIVTRQFFSTRTDEFITLHSQLITNEDIRFLFFASLSVSTTRTMGKNSQNRSFRERRNSSIGPRRRGRWFPFPLWSPQHSTSPLRFISFEIEQGVHPSNIPLSSIVADRDWTRTNLRRWSGNWERAEVAGGRKTIGRKSRVDWLRKRCKTVPIRALRPRRWTTCASAGEYLERIDDRREPLLNYFLWLRLECVEWMNALGKRSCNWTVRWWRQERWPKWKNYTSESNRLRIAQRDISRRQTVVHRALLRFYLPVDREPIEECTAGGPQPIE